MKKRYKTPLGYYYKGAETLDFIYYVNYAESDENACVRIYNRTGELISDNYFAYSDLFNTLEQGIYIWISRTLKRNYDKSLVDSN